MPMLQEPVAGAREATLNAIKSRQFALKPVHKSEDGGVRAQVTSAQARVLVIIGYDVVCAWHM